MFSVLSNGRLSGAGGKKAELDGRLWGTENYRILWKLCQDGDRYAHKVGTAGDRAEQTSGYPKEEDSMGDSFPH